MSSKRYTPEFKDEAVRKFDQSRSYRYPDDRLSRGYDHIHQASQDRIALLATPTAYQGALIVLAADTSIDTTGHVVTTSSLMGG